MKYLFKRDIFLATISVFLVIAILLYNPLNEYIFNPLKITFTDFALTDLAFSQSHEKAGVDDRIVIINSDTAKRETIARILDHLEAYQPAVVGLDVLLPEKKDPGNDQLAAVFHRFPSIILSSFARHDDKTKTYSMVANQFVSGKTQSGFVNFLGQKGNVVRYFPPFLGEDTNRYESFAAVVTKYKDSTCYSRLADRNNNLEWINYRRGDSGYACINFQDLLNDRIDSSFIKGKIVLIGFLTSDSNNIVDKHYTPLNHKILGRSVPDMNGIMIHANIISMLLDGEYIHEAPEWLTILLAVIITWLHTAFLVKYYLHKHLWFHLIVKTFELLASILLFYLSIMLLRYERVHIDFTLTLVAIIIGVDVLYFYEALANWLTRKYSVPSVFSQAKSHL